MKKVVAIREETTAQIVSVGDVVSIYSKTQKKRVAGIVYRIDENSCMCKYTTGARKPISLSDIQVCSDQDKAAFWSEISSSDPRFFFDFASEFSFAVLMKMPVDQALLYLRQKVDSLSEEKGENKGLTKFFSQMREIREVLTEMVSDSETAEKAITLAENVFSEDLELAAEPIDVSSEVKVGSIRKIGRTDGSVIPVFVFFMGKKPVSLFWANNKMMVTRSEILKDVVTTQDRDAILGDIFQNFDAVSLNEDIKLSMLAAMFRYGSVAQIRGLLDQKVIIAQVVGQ
jgi:hypothetical protein